MAGRTYAPIRLRTRHGNRVKSTVPGAPKDPARYLKDRARIEMLEEIETEKRKEAEARSEQKAPSRPKTFKGKMASGGKVRGCGVAQRGLTKGTMR